MKKLLSLLLMIMITCSVGIAYATGAGDTETVTSLKYVTDELNTRQDKFGANDGKAMTFTNTAGGNAPRDVKSSLGTSTSDTGLPTVSAVNAGLDDKQNTIPAVNTNTVITYTGVEGTIGQKGIYQDTGTYAAQSDNLIDAGTFNAALRNGLENEFVCADRDPVSNQCWLWTIDNATDETITVHGKNLFNPNNLPTFTGDLSYIVGRQPEPISDGFKVTLESATNTNYNYYLYLPMEEGYVYSCEAPSVGRFTTLNNKWAFIYSNRGNGGLPAGTVIEFHKVQLERGSTATPYEPYVDETVNLYIPQNQ